MNKKIILTLACLLSCLGFSAMAEATTVYLLKSSAWATTKIYAWKPNNAGELWSWDSSKTMTETVSIDGIDYLKYTFDGEYDSLNVIFRSNSEQTVDIEGVTPGETFFKRLTTKDSQGHYKYEIINPYVLTAPSISADGNTVTITASADGGQVYYTIDGSEPDNTSTLYTAPFELAADATVRAIQMKEVAKSDIVDFDFTWTFIAPALGKQYALYVGTGADPVEICATDQDYLPVEGGAKAAGQPDVLYLVGNIVDHSWEMNYEFKATRYGKCFVFENVELKNGTKTDAYFSFTTKLGANWDAVNTGDRYGAESNDAPLSQDAPLNIKKFTANGTASGACAWKVDAGTYRIVVNFEKNTVLLTQKEGPQWQPMTATDAEADMMSAAAGVLYRAELEGNLSVAFKEGDTCVEAGKIEAGASYVYHDGKWEVLAPVAVGLAGDDKGVLTSDTRLVCSPGTETAMYFDGEWLDIVDGSASIAMLNADDNALAELKWEATNAQGITFYGSHSLINHTEAMEEVRVYARVPKAWTSVSYTIVSDVNPDHTDSGIVDQPEGHYFYFVVPAHLYHSTLTFSNTGAPAAAHARIAAEETRTYQLAGKTMYFDHEGDHWDDHTYGNVSTGIDTIEAEQAPAVFYNLQGMPVEKPGTGIYIMRRGAEVTKIVR
ncbi:MAG: chitobiase/beta-hexosaminidase C-terminal domain-containing protein [Muribaculaceae bacterium]|nr:chitobiase/beta-hexosaminidase C-terminal domain-containing protein [Muribaculaceae bacterium]